jgi:hypothetical protein
VEHGLISAWGSFIGEGVTETAWPGLVIYALSTIAKYSPQNNTHKIMRMRRTLVEIVYNMYGTKDE